MSRKCKRGQRARIIGDSANRGRIVLVVRQYIYPELVSDASWPKLAFPWVVTSLGGPLRSCYIDGTEAPPSRTIVFDDRDLEPLDDDGPIADESSTERADKTEQGAQVRALSRA